MSLEVAEEPPTSKRRRRSTSSQSSSSSSSSSNQLSTREVQRKSKSNSTITKYEGIALRFYDYLVASVSKYYHNEDTNNNERVTQDGLFTEFDEPTMGIDAIWTCIKWGDLTWQPTIAQYLKKATWNTKGNKSYGAGVAEGIWAAYCYGLKILKLVRNELMFPEFSEYLSGFKRILAEVAESTGAGTSKGKDPLER